MLKTKCKLLKHRLKNIRSIARFNLSKHKVKEMAFDIDDISKPAITIIIPNYNTTKYLKECLKSIKQTLADEKTIDTEAIKVIVIENGSVDGGKEFLMDYAENNSFVMPLILDKNIGVYNAWNLGIIASDPNDVIIMGSDVVCLDGWLHPLLDTINSDLSIGIVSSKLIQKIDGKDFVVFGGVGEHTPHLIGWNHEHPEFNEIKQQPWVTHSCVLIRRETINAVIKKRGFAYDARYRIYCGDHDFCREAKLCGWKSYYCGPSTVIHHEGKGVTQLKHNKIQTIKKIFNQMFRQSIKAMAKEDANLFDKEWSDRIYLLQGDHCDYK